MLVKKLVFDITSQIFKKKRLFLSKINKNLLFSDASATVGEQ